MLCALQTKFFSAPIVDFPIIIANTCITSKQRTTSLHRTKIARPNVSIFGCSTACMYSVIRISVFMGYYSVVATELCHNTGKSSNVNSLH